MGSPLSSFLIAEAVMQDLEKRSVTNNNNMKTWTCRYVDDILATVKKDKTNEILQTINNTTGRRTKQLWKKNKTTNSLSSTFF
jgi:hypothetical protein